MIGKLEDGKFERTAQSVYHVAALSNQPGDVATEYKALMVLWPSLRLGLCPTCRQYLYLEHTDESQKIVQSG